jgi:hypothetical protein
MRFRFASISDAGIALHEEHETGPERDIRIALRFIQKRRSSAEAAEGD